MNPRGLAVRQGQFASPAVAMLRWANGTPEVHILDTAAEANLRQYLRTALSKPPFRIRRRQRAEGRSTDLVAEEVAPSDADFLGRWAAKLTFNPLNTHDFIFTAAQDQEASLASQSEALELTSDLFELSGTFKSSVIPCPCGAQYPFLTLKCPKCGGTDPFGALWKKRGDAILQALSDFTRGQIASNSSLRESLQAAQKAFRGAVAAKADPAMIPLETDDTATTSHKLLSYYEGVFRRGCLNEEIIGALKVAPGRECYDMTNGLRNAARGMRSLWRAGSTVAWNPSKSFTTKCQISVLDYARPALQETGQTAKQMVKVAAQFGPFHHEFKRRVAPSEVTGWKIFKAAWTVFKAVHTFGGSLLLKGALKVMKDRKFQQRFERFSAAFDNAVESCAKTEKVIDHSLHLHTELLSRIAKGMRYHLMAVFAEDYATANQDEQDRMADSLAKIVHCPPLKRRALHGRGLKAQERRKILIAWCVVGGFILLLCIAALVVILFR